MFSKRKFAVLSVFIFMTVSVFASGFSYGMGTTLIGISTAAGSKAAGKSAGKGERKTDNKPDSAVGAVTNSGISAYVEGCKLYSEGDWTSATIMLKKAVSYAENFRPDVYYMLITAEVYANDKRSALDDCNIFLNNFSESSLSARVKYHKGKILYDLGEYDKAIIELSDFCHQYADDELYSHSLFYIGESLFAGYRYEEAKGIFERIVNEFPESDKVAASQYRIDTIKQHAREEKLLYLLKQTGEEYLSAKEEYEKQLKMYNSETVNATRQKLSDALSKNNMLEKQVADLQSQLEAAKGEIKKVETERDAAVERYNELSAVHEQYVPAVPVIEGSNSQPTAKEEVKTTEINDVYVKTDDVPAESFVPGNNISPDKSVKKDNKPEEDIPSLVPYDETQKQLRILKEKAREVQKFFDSKSENKN